MTNQPAQSAPTNNEGDLSNKAPADAKATDGQAQPNAKPDANTPKGDEGKKADEGKADDNANAEGKTDEGKKPEDDKKPEVKAPEKYEAFTLPEGVEMTSEQTEAFSALAKELNLTQEQAQKLAEYGGNMLVKAKPDDAAIVEQAKEVWGKETKADKEIGGDKLAENLAVAKKTLETFGTPALKDLLNKSGMGNHPEVIRLFYKVGKQIGEDNVLISGGRPSSSENAADKLYGSTSKPSK